LEKEQQARKEQQAQKELPNDREKVYDNNNNLILKVPEIKHPEWLI